MCGFYETGKKSEKTKEDLKLGKEFIESLKKKAKKNK